ncbi:hypothetical protein LJR231_000250 [Phyllobacterium sp. LjRoot231]|uniref:hypothetical protein n=1 Tax=Phyllobacterium sp. LjRoot231 TaxID=3342289 RepID=UPI003ECC2E3E
MIGLFLPRLRVVSLLHRQHLSPVRLTQPVIRACRNGPLALIRNAQQDGSGDVSAHI